MYKGQYKVKRLCAKHDIVSANWLGARAGWWQGGCAVGLPPTCPTAVTFAWMLSYCHHFLFLNIAKNLPAGLIPAA